MFIPMRDVTYGIKIKVSHLLIVNMKEVLKFLRQGSNWFWELMQLCTRPSTPLNSPAAPSNFCRESKDVLVSTHTF